ncbi:MAG: cytochrome c [Deltaproteobacteria bacterium]|jgi:mono/diheme cytochrome c family protein|nr:cytochrome c [Deltaproteobacteria bacterium]
MTEGDPVLVNEAALRRERPEPKEDLRPPGPGLYLFFAGMTAWGAFYLAAYGGEDLRPRGGDSRTAPLLVVQRGVDGKQVYTANCAVCHQANGQGLAGNFPPLAGSSWVTEDQETIVRILLRGIEGPIEVKGVTYNGVMPAFPHLSDEQLAAVATYARGNFGNEASPIPVELVVKLRQALANQKGAWAGGAALKEAQKAP